MSDPIAITGTGVLSAAGEGATLLWQRLCDGDVCVEPVDEWSDVSPRRLVGRVGGCDPYEAIRERKLHKLVRRGDALAIAAVAQAIDAAKLLSHRDALAESLRAEFNARTGIFVGAPGGALADQHDFLPLIAEVGSDLPAFGQRLARRVPPTWLLRSLPNNALCHIGINWGLSGPGTTIVDDSVSGVLALIDAAEAVREDLAERALVSAHEAAIEPHALALRERHHGPFTAVARPFDESARGSPRGEGAAAAVLESLGSAYQRGATVEACYLGGACVSSSGDLLAAVDQSTVERVIQAALEDAGRDEDDLAVVIAHGDATTQGDEAEARAIAAICGDEVPVTASKWSIGHTGAAAGLVDVALAVKILRHGVVPGIATTSSIAAPCRAAAIQLGAWPIRYGTCALVLCHATGGVSAAAVIGSARR